MDGTFPVNIHLGSSESRFSELDNAYCATIKIHIDNYIL